MTNARPSNPYFAIARDMMQGRSEHVHGVALCYADWLRRSAIDLGFDSPFLLLRWLTLGRAGVVPNVWEARAIAYLESRDGLRNRIRVAWANEWQHQRKVHEL